jgi:hypothetical protein
MKTQKRAGLVGKITGSGANPGDGTSLRSLRNFIPSGRAANPTTRTNSDCVGVKPDIATPPPLHRQRRISSSFAKNSLRLPTPTGF